jgi:hypothetical protein
MLGLSGMPEQRLRCFLGSNSGTNLDESQGFSPLKEMERMCEMDRNGRGEDHKEVETLAEKACKE